MSIGTKDAYVELCHNCVRDRSGLQQFKNVVCNTWCNIGPKWCIEEHCKIAKEIKDKEKEIMLREETQQNTETKKKAAAQSSIIYVKTKHSKEMNIQMGAIKRSITAIRRETKDPDIIETLDRADSYVKKYNKQGIMICANRFEKTSPQRHEILKPLRDTIERNKRVYNKRKGEEI